MSDFPATDVVERLRGHAEEFDACYGPDEAALLREAALEIERLQQRTSEFERSYRDLAKQAETDGVDVMVWVNAQTQLIQRQRQELARLHAQLRQHAETCKESAWPLGEPK